MATDSRDYPAHIWAGQLGGGKRIWKPELTDAVERAFCCEYVRADLHAALEAEVERLREALERLVNAKALAGVRAMVAGWNGEDRPEPYAERHPSRLGATLPKTNCGAVYELDEAMQAARAALAGRAG